MLHLVPGLRTRIQSPPLKLHSLTKRSSPNVGALRAAKLDFVTITREMRLQVESTKHEDDPARATLEVRVRNETSAHMELLSLCEYRSDLQHRRAIRDLLRLGEMRKMNFNRQTHFDKATKELMVPDPIANPILEVSEAA